MCSQGSKKTVEDEIPHVLFGLQVLHPSSLRPVVTTHLTPCLQASELHPVVTEEGLAMVMLVALNGERDTVGEDVAGGHVAPGVCAPTGKALADVYFAQSPSKCCGGGCRCCTRMMEQEAFAIHRFRRWCTSRKNRSDWAEQRRFRSPLSLGIIGDSGSYSQTCCLSLGRSPIRLRP